MVGKNLESQYNTPLHLVEQQKLRCGHPKDLEDLTVFDSLTTYSSLYYKRVPLYSFSNHQIFVLVQVDS